MSSEPTAKHATSGHDASQRQRFGLILAGGVGLIAAWFSYFGTRDAWVTADRRADADTVATSGGTMDPAWDLDLPRVPHRDEFQISCLICHSARLPLSQPTFHREQWIEIVHKMVAVYGAPMSPEDESRVVDYLVAARPPGP